MKFIEIIDPIITKWMARYGIYALRLSIGLIFIWFGALKFFPGFSPAEALALSTIEILTFGFVEPEIAQFLLALFEVTIGFLLLIGRYVRITILLLLVQMAGTMSPILLFPDVVFTTPPFVLTIEGQYILKNFVVISAAMVIGATARGGNLRAEPDSV